MDALDSTLLADGSNIVAKPPPARCCRWPRGHWAEGSPPRDRHLRAKATTSRKPPGARRSPALSSAPALPQSVRPDPETRRRAAATLPLLPRDAPTAELRTALPIRHT